MCPQTRAMLGLEQSRHRPLVQIPSCVALHHRTIGRPRRGHFLEQSQLGCDSPAADSAGTFGRVLPPDVFCPGPAETSKRVAARPLSAPVQPDRANRIPSGTSSACASRSKRSRRGRITRSFSGRETSTCRAPSPMRSANACRDRPSSVRQRFTNSPRVGTTGSLFLFCRYCALGANLQRMEVSADLGLRTHSMHSGIVQGICRICPSTGGETRMGRARSGESRQCRCDIAGIDYASKSEGLC